MKNPFNMKSACLAALLLALAPCARPALAQSDMDDAEEMNEMGMMSHPLAFNYPQSIPGGLDLFHYTDYTMTKLKPGSAMDAIEMMTMKMDAKMEQDRMMRDANMTDAQKMRMMKLYPPVPLAFNYPQSIPGGLDLFHYMDYSGTSLMEGSARDMLEMQMKERDEEMMSMMPMGSNMGMMGDMDSMNYDAFPLAFNYPEAIPGGLDLFHYPDFTKTSIEPGSAADAIEMKMREMDEKKMNDGAMPMPKK